MCGSQFCLNILAGNNVTFPGTKGRSFIPVQSYSVYKMSGLSKAPQI